MNETQDGAALHVGGKDRSQTPKCSNHNWYEGSRYPTRYMMISVLMGYYLSILRDGYAL